MQSCSLIGIHDRLRTHLNYLIACYANCGWFSNYHFLDPQQKGINSPAYFY